MRLFLGLVLFLTALILASCPDTGNWNDDKKGEEIPSFSKVEELFVSETDEEGNTVTVFKTNDKKYWTQEGLTLWTVWGDDKETFRQRKVEMAKPNGYSGGGYGIVFCQGEHEINEKSSSVMLVAMINNAGEYILGKAYGGIFVDFGWWKMSSYLNKGTGVPNEIEVIYEETEKEFIFYINGYEVEKFKDEEEPALCKGRNGYIAVTTPYDNFPASVVDVLFKEEL